MTCSRIILQTRSVTGGDFSCKMQLETPLRCKLQEKIPSCDMALNLVEPSRPTQASSCAQHNILGNMCNWLSLIIGWLVPTNSNRWSIMKLQPTPITNRNTSRGLGEREIEVFPPNFDFRVLPNFHECFYIVWEHGGGDVFCFFYKITHIENYNVEIVFFTPKCIFSVLFMMAYAMAYNGVNLSMFSIQL